MSLHSYHILKTELNNLEEFYRITLSAYQEVKDVLVIRTGNSPEIDKYLKSKKINMGRSLNKFSKSVVIERTETMLRELILVRAISALETFLVDAIRDIFVVTKIPFMDSSIRHNLSQENLIANISPTKILNRIIQGETRKLTSGGFNDFIKYYKKRFKIDLSSISPGYKVMNEYHDRRHILVHRLGQTDEEYRNKYGIEEKSITVDSEYTDKLLRDIKVFSKDVKIQVESFLDDNTVKASTYNARYSVDILFVKQNIPDFLQPSFQFWADDEYVVMSDVLLGTSPAEDGRVRYYFNGSDSALKKINSFLKKEQKRFTISLINVVNLIKYENGAVKVTEEDIQNVQNQLPQQPWPIGIHKVIAKNLNLSNGLVSDAIGILIARGIFQPQVDGKLVKKYRGQF